MLTGTLEARQCIDALGARELLALQVGCRLALAAVEGRELSPRAAAHEVAGTQASAAVGEVVSAVALSAYRAENPGVDPLPPAGVNLVMGAELRKRESST